MHKNPAETDSQNRSQETFDLGLTSLSALGVVGVVVEVILIGYLFVTSLVGLYTIPIIKRIK
jgi:hypothetical protein